MVLYRHRVVHLCPWRSTSLHLSLSPARARRARDASLQNKSLGWDPLFQFSTACLFLLATDFIQCSSLVELHQVNNLVYISFFSFFWRCAVVLLSYLSSSYSDMNHLNQFILKMICSQNHSVFWRGSGGSLLPLLRTVHSTITLEFPINYAIRDAHETWQHQV